MTAIQTALSSEAPFIQNLITQQKFVTVYLVSGVQLKGYIISYDTYSLLLKGSAETGGKQVWLYKRAISTISSHGAYNELKENSNEDKENKVHLSRSMRPREVSYL